MGIALSGRTSSNGSPASYYEYQYEFSNRTATSVHLKLWLRVRMAYSSNYFSFQIAHETKTFGGSMDGPSNYQFAWIKKGRGWWGHQGSIGDGWLWTVGSYDYYGDNWHGWYLVYDGEVFVGIDDDRAFVVPVITRPPCTYNRYYFGGDWTPSLDKTCWQGQSGYWRPWGNSWWSSSPYEYFYYTDHTCPQDMAFGNNQYCQPLSDPYDGQDGIRIGTYPRPEMVSGTTFSPSRIDVAEQDTAEVAVSWLPATNAVAYTVAVMRDPDNQDPFVNRPGESMVVSQNYVGTSISFNMKAQIFGGTNWMQHEIMDGERFYIAVRAHDNANIESVGFAVIGPVTYYERKSVAPNGCFVIGRNGERNQILFKGEPNVRLYWSGESNGSYPIERYCLRRQDGVELWWNASEPVKRDINGRYIVKAISGWDRPNEDVSFELRAYNTMGREVYLANGGWFSFSVRFYGGILYVYGKESYVGSEPDYDGDASAERWHEGLARVWGKRYFYGNENSYRALSDEPTWHEAELVYVWDGNRWRSL